MDDDEVRRRRNHGLTRLTEQDRAELPHPGRGGSLGYPVWNRRVEIARAQAGLETTAHRISISRWTDRLTPYRMTGNNSQDNIVGSDLLLLVIFMTIYPSAEHDEMATFIYNEGGRLYSRQDISKRLIDMEVTRKVASTEAYQAFLPRNIWRCNMFWSQPPPLGVVTIPRRTMIDVDEFGMSMNRCESKRGYSLSCFRVRKPGHYERTQKLTVLFAIEPGDHRLPPQARGSIWNPRRWIKVIRDGGTTAFVFAEFLEEILVDIETNPVTATDVDDVRHVLFDNLRSHLAPVVAQTIEVRPPGSNTTFTSIARPPYQPKYGPIEYKICDLVETVGRQTTRDWTTADLEQALVREAARLSFNTRSFDNTFDHCGYTVDGVY